MKAPVKVHTKSCILALLLLVWGALLPAYACAPEADKAVAQLQKSARAKIRAEDWLVQVVNKTSTFYNLRPKGSLRTIIGIKIIQKKLWSALFPDKRSLIYLKKYLAEVEIQQNDDMDKRSSPKSSPREFSFNGTKYTYYYIYPASNSPSVVSETGCQFEITLLYAPPVPDDFPADGVRAFYYCFALINGKMKLVGINMAG